jgi:hypothetical protein
MAKKRKSRYLKESKTTRSQAGEDLNNILLLAFGGVILYYIFTSGNPSFQQYPPYPY